MLKKRTYQTGISADFGKLHSYWLLQLFALTQWPASMAGALGMTPQQLVGIGVGRIARQEPQLQSPTIESNIVLYDLRLVRGQTIQYPVQRLLLPVQQLLEQFYQHLAVGCPFVGSKPECAFRNYGFTVSVKINKYSLSTTTRC